MKKIKQLAWWLIVPISMLRRRLVSGFWIALFILAMLIMIPDSHAEPPSLALTIEVMERESSGRYNAKKAKSYGIMAFEKATFDEFKIKAGMPKLRWKNPIHQLLLWSWMYDHGYADRWVGYRMYMHTEPPMDSLKDVK